MIEGGRKSETIEDKNFRYAKILQRNIPLARKWCNEQKKWRGLGQTFQDAGGGPGGTAENAVLVFHYQDDKHAFAHPVQLWDIDPFQLENLLTKKWINFAYVVGKKISREKRYKK